MSARPRRGAFLRAQGNIIDTPIVAVVEAPKRRRSRSKRRYSAPGGYRVVFGKGTGRTRSAHFKHPHLENPRTYLMHGGRLRSTLWGKKEKLRKKYRRRPGIDEAIAKIINVAQRRGRRAVSFVPGPHVVKHRK